MGSMETTEATETLEKLRSPLELQFLFTHVLRYAMAVDGRCRH